jgi:hypothetical protein
MKSMLMPTVVWLFGAAAAHGVSSVTPWVPIFQGIEQASGTNNAAAAGPLSVHALRLDLQDPDLRLVITPPVTNNYIPNQRETLFQTPREFLREHQAQVAINAVHFSPPGYLSQSGDNASLYGLVISEGRLVSTQSDTNLSASALLFTSNKEPSFVFFNWPPVDTTGVYHAVAGMFPLLHNGTNIGYAYTNQVTPGGDGIHDDQPRTAFGLSQDNRYLILLTIDGRQPGFSAGAYDWETAEFLLLMGAWNGMALDGGGSTCMVKADECGEPVDINRNSYQYARGPLGAQRPIGCNFGAFAKPLLKPIREVVVEPATTTALITWKTETPASTQVEYGLTTNYGSATVWDSRLARFHTATLTGLIPGSNYFFRARSDTGFEEYTFACRFPTAFPAAIRTLVFDVTNSWKYTTNNLDGVNWKAPNYDDSSWLGPGPGLLHTDSSPLGAPKNTVLPPGILPTGSPFPRTFYFRTPFTFAGSSAGLSLVFSNYVDDGAVFYLNGVEIHRLRMQPSPAVITNLSLAASAPCPPSNDAICPDMFAVTGNLLTNLVQGSNVLAVEVHNSSGAGTDVAFGSALFLSNQAHVDPQLHIVSEDGLATLYWNAQGFWLQELNAFSSSPAASNVWGNVSSTASNSPVIVPATGTMFFRLRQ